jgi:tRNA threonylcarbamoyladenosine biosynthesis protein TsaB
MTGRILAIDTASGQCSVALLCDGGLVSRAQVTARDHARLLLPMVDEVLAEAGLALAGVDGIAFGRGPGSFTGVRIAAAVAQGLALGAGLPVLPVSDLRALAEAARGIPSVPADGPPGEWLLACMDARMGEVYWALFRDEGKPVGTALGTERLSSPGDLCIQVASALPAGAKVDRAAGMGLGAWPSLREQLRIATVRCLPAAEPHAVQVVALAAFDLANGIDWLDASAAQPVYLRDKVVQPAL